MSFYNVTDPHLTDMLSYALNMCRRLKFRNQIDYILALRHTPKTIIFPLNDIGSDQDHQAENEQKEQKPRQNAVEFQAKSWCKFALNYLKQDINNPSACGFRLQAYKF